MTDTALPRRGKLLDRWPTALALVVTAAAVVVIALVDREAELFGPSVATMAGIYLVAYATGRPWMAWLAFPALSAVVSVLHVLNADPALGMTILLVPLWLWTVAQRRFTDARTFWVQTAGMVGFGAITLLCAAAQPRFGTVLAGIGFLTHGAWDACHFKADRVVNRPWSEFCGLLDLAIGTALIVAAAG